MKFSFKIIAIITLLAFTATSVVSSVSAQALPSVGGGSSVGTIHESPLQQILPVFNGIKIYPQEPFRFDFIVAGSDEPANDSERGISRAEEFPLQRTPPNPLFQKEGEYLKLIKYFMAALTVPEGDLWVNLSPYEADRIVPNALGQTEMGRDLLAQDYVLKQLTASLMNPEGETGKKFWDKIYSRTYEKLGNTNISVDTFNKVWIVPNRVEIFQNQDVAYIVHADFKVMLESDYLAQEKSVIARGPKGDEAIPEIALADAGLAMTDETKQIIRDIVIPAIEDEVNTGESFALLRQIFHSVILAKWYEQHFKNSVLGQSYVDHNTTDGITLTNGQGQIKTIYDQYVSAFKQGAYDLIKEDYDPATQTIMPRKYFSGGVEAKIANMAMLNKIPDNVAQAMLTDQDVVGVMMEIEQSHSASEGLLDKAQLADIESMIDTFISGHPDSRIIPEGQKYEAPFLLRDKPDLRDFFFELHTEIGKTALHYAFQKESFQGDQGDIVGKYLAALEQLKENLRIQFVTPTQLGRMVEVIVQDLTSDPDPYAEESAKIVTAFEAMSDQIEAAAGFDAFKVQFEKDGNSDGWQDVLSNVFVLAAVSGQTDTTFRRSKFFGLEKTITPFLTQAQKSIPEINFEDDSAVSAYLDQVLRERSIEVTDQDVIATKLMKLGISLIGNTSEYAKIESRQAFDAWIKKIESQRNKPILIRLDDKEDFVTVEYQVKTLLMAGFQVVLASEPDPVMNKTNVSWLTERIGKDDFYAPYSKKLKILSTGIGLAGTDLNHTGDDFNEALVGASSIISNGSTNKEGLIQEDLQLPAAVVTAVVASETELFIKFEYQVDNASFGGNFQHQPAETSDPVKLGVVMGEGSAKFYFDSVVQPILKMIFEKRLPGQELEFVSENIAEEAKDEDFVNIYKMFLDQGISNIIRFSFNGALYRERTRTRAVKVDVFEDVEKKILFAEDFTQGYLAETDIAVVQGKELKVKSSVQWSSRNYKYILRALKNFSEQKGVHPQKIIFFSKKNANPWPAKCLEFALKFYRDKEKDPRGFFHQLQIEFAAYDSQDSWAEKAKGAGEDWIFLADHVSGKRLFDGLVKNFKPGVNREVLAQREIYAVPGRGNAWVTGYQTVTGASMGITNHNPLPAVRMVQLLIQDLNQRREFKGKFDGVSEAIDQVIVENAADVQQKLTLDDVNGQDLADRLIQKIDEKLDQAMLSVKFKTENIIKLLGLALAVSIVITYHKDILTQLNGFYHWYLDALKTTNGHLIRIATAAMFFFFGDWVRQKFSEGKTFNFNNAVRMSFIGGVLALMLYGEYALLDWIFQSTAHPVLYRVIAHMATFMWINSFFIIYTNQILQNIKLKKYQFQKATQEYWILTYLYWAPVQLLGYAWIDLEYRVLVANIASFIFAPVNGMYSTTKPQIMVAILNRWGIRWNELRDDVQLHILKTPWSEFFKCIFYPSERAKFITHVAVMNHRDEHARQILSRYLDRIKANGTKFLEKGIYRFVNLFDDYIRHDEIQSWSRFSEIYDELMKIVKSSDDGYAALEEVYLLLFVLREKGLLKDYHKYGRPLLECVNKMLKQNQGLQRLKALNLRNFYANNSEILDQDASSALFFSENISYFLLLLGFFEGRYFDRLLDVLLKEHEQPGILKDLFILRYAIKSERDMNFLIGRLHQNGPPILNLEDFLFKTKDWGIHRGKDESVHAWDLFSLTLSKIKGEEGSVKYPLSLFEFLEENFQTYFEFYEHIAEKFPRHGREIIELLIAAVWEGRISRLFPLEEQKEVSVWLEAHVENLDDFKDFVSERSSQMKLQAVLLTQHAAIDFGIRHLYQELTDDGWTELETLPSGCKRFILQQEKLRYELYVPPEGENLTDSAKRFLNLKYKLDKPMKVPFVILDDVMINGQHYSLAAARIFDEDDHIESYEPTSVSELLKTKVIDPYFLKKGVSLEHQDSFVTYRRPLSVEEVKYLYSSGAFGMGRFFGDIYIMERTTADHINITSLPEKYAYEMLGVDQQGLLRKMVQGELGEPLFVRFPIALFDFPEISEQDAWDSNRGFGERINAFESGRRNFSFVELYPAMQQGDQWRHEVQRFFAIRENSSDVLLTPLQDKEFLKLLINKQHVDQRSGTHHLGIVLAEGTSEFYFNKVVKPALELIFQKQLPRVQLNFVTANVSENPDVGRWDEIYRDFSKQDIKNIFRFSFSAQALYPDRAKNAAFKYSVFHFGPKTIVVAQDMTQGVFAKERYQTVNAPDGDRVISSTESPKWSLKGFEKLLHRIQRFSRGRGIVSNRIIYFSKHHRVDGLSQMFLNANQMAATFGAAETYEPQEIKNICRNLLSRPVDDPVTILTDYMTAKEVIRFFIKAQGGVPDWEGSRSVYADPEDSTSENVVYQTIVGSGLGLEPRDTNPLPAFYMLLRFLEDLNVSHEYQNIFGPTIDLLRIILNEHSKKLGPKIGLPLGVQGDRLAAEIIRDLAESLGLEEPADNAQMTSVAPDNGGIDLNKLNMQTSGQASAIQMPTDPAMMQPIRMLTPQIIHIGRINTGVFLGLNQEQPDSKEESNIELLAVRDET